MITSDVELEEAEDNGIVPSRGSTSEAPSWFLLLGDVRFVNENNEGLVSEAASEKFPILKFQHGLHDGGSDPQARVGSSALGNASARDAVIQG